ncbi:anthranilate synthase component II [Saccharicrinis sp. FJH62]|uniref:anthranilate synthase component II n=1 Tax=Saccharicrinis sp. FJH62 TaxID=3344657 RepID=UPI0035D4452A
MKILVLDNYDSFTYNLVHYLKELSTAQVDVYRNDEISVEEVGKYDKILLSPGPGIPDEAGILKPLIKRWGESKSIFGVCLGCQAIAEVYGGSIYNLNKVYHGVATTMRITDKEELLYKNVSEEFEAGRYHSWVVSKEDLPKEMHITSVDDKGAIMGIRHQTHNVRGVQFHPESILTPEGKKMIKNWLENC